MNKSCQTCKHYKRSWIATLLLFTDENDKCMRPIKYVTQPEFPYRFTTMERNPGYFDPDLSHLNICGPEGKFHEPK